MEWLQHIHLAPVREMVPSTSVLLGSISNLKELSLQVGLTEWKFPLLDDKPNERTNGISRPQAGLGHFTVLAQIQAMTVRSTPSLSFTVG